MKKKKTLIILLIISIIIICYFTISNVQFIAPVKGSNRNSYSQDDFLSPRDGHKHKGIDIFAKSGTPVLSATNGIVVYTGVFKLGGNIVLVMDPHLRYHYYAHLSKIETYKFAMVSLGDEIGKVGNTGNAINTPSHLHYSVLNPLKIFSYEVKGVKYKTPYLNPTILLNNYFNNVK